MHVDVIQASLAFGAHTVFTDVDARFEAGRVTALVGPSGSGKSSLLAVMAGYLRLDAGRVELRAADGSTSGPRPDLVAWVPQGSNALGRRTVLDNVAIAPLSAGAGPRAAAARAGAALATVGLAAKAEVQARRLSGGELQRVALARALASDAQLIFADEPSANLDAANTAIIAEILARLTARATIVVATHDPVLVAAADVAVHLRPQSTARPPAPAALHGS